MRYCSSEFSETHCATLGGAYAEKKMEIKDEENLVLCIWDTCIIRFW